jgi:hypothetical protein
MFETGESCRGAKVGGANVGENPRCQNVTRHISVSAQGMGNRRREHGRRRRRECPEPESWRRGRKQRRAGGGVENGKDVYFSMCNVQHMSLSQQQQASGVPMRVKSNIIPQ